MQNRGRFGLRGEYFEVLDRGGRLHGESDFLLFQGFFAVVVDHDDVLQPGQLVENLPDLAHVFPLGEDDLCAGVLQAEVKGLVAESRKQGLGDGADLKDTDKTDVELGDPVEKEADPVLVFYAEASQIGADAVAVNADIVVGESLFHTALAFPDEGGFSAVPLVANPVRTVPSDVDDISVAVFQFLFGNGPVELFDSLVV